MATNLLEYLNRGKTLAPITQANPANNQAERYRQALLAALKTSIGEPTQQRLTVPGFDPNMLLMMIKTIPAEQIPGFMTLIKQVVTTYENTLAELETQS